ncbi:alpha/beta hydrolase [Erythrobacter rubeus]|uniref:Alpha/beta hydrolase n=1 Tax=Erythrobacter rubeus TaxID=2760803 RepID=A0ABR8KST6_9SPHN|nr:alpha/beta hydrolase-fold protein [Erythrobacter rubeus]MBD2843029.1 alpha/beta hydrolase [Erythrobacter rubeus]
MIRTFLAPVAALAAVTGMLAPQTASANPQLAYTPGARANMEVLETRRVQSDRFEYEHAVTIALPATYAVKPDARYPVLWVLDDPLMTRSAIAAVDLLVAGNMMPEVIVIGVGSPSEDGLAGVGRRVIEFSPPGEGFAAPGLNREAVRSVAPFPPYPHRAEDFLAFLADELRPELAAEFRFADDHILHGHSLGGLFAGYALFTRPDLFDRMIIGSPAMANVGDAVFKLEEVFSQENDALPVEIFVGAGGEEGNEWFLNAGGILTGTARFIETLNLRGYEGLSVTSRFYDGEDHYTVAPRIISDALRSFYREEAAATGSTWPQKP